MGQSATPGSLEAGSKSLSGTWGESESGGGGEAKGECEGEREGGGEGGDGEGGGEVRGGGADAVVSECGCGLGMRSGEGSKCTSHRLAAARLTPQRTQ